MGREPNYDRLILVAAAVCFACGLFLKGLAEEEKTNASTLSIYVVDSYGDDVFVPSDDNRYIQRKIATLNPNGRTLLRFLY